MAEARAGRVGVSELIGLATWFLRLVRDSVWLKLLVCLTVDAFGAASLLLPGLGEIGDVGWAPLHGTFLFYMFGTHRLTALGFLEEMLPGLDFVRTNPHPAILRISHKGHSALERYRYSQKQTLMHPECATHRFYSAPGVSSAATLGAIQTVGAISLRGVGLRELESPSPVPRAPAGHHRRPAPRRCTDLGATASRASQRAMSQTAGRYQGWIESAHRSQVREQEQRGRIKT